MTLISIKNGRNTDMSRDRDAERQKEQTENVPLRGLSYAHFHLDYEIVILEDVFKEKISRQGKME